MKLVTSIVTLCVFIGTLHAQSDYTKSLNGIDWVKIESKSGIVIKTHDRNELLIKVSSFKGKSEKAKGLKLVGAGGTDNTDVGFYVVQDGNTLLVKNLRKGDKARIFLPKTKNISVTNSWNGFTYVEGFSSEVEVNSNLNGSVQLENLSGPVTAYALNGSIVAVLTKINQNSPTVIRTTNGEIDVTLPGNTPANIELASVNSDIYTNFDIRLPEKNGLRAISGRKVMGAVNGGGVDVKLKSVNGTVYLRKQ